MKGIKFPQLDGSNLRIGIVVARWNSEITYALRDSAVKALKESNVDIDNIVIQKVPGSFELVYGANKMVHSGFDAVLVLGVLIKGETMHFEYLSEAVCHGIAKLNADTDAPVVYGVLNCLDEEQALARATGANNHGFLWGKTAVEMGLLKSSVL